MISVILSIQISCSGDYKYISLDNTHCLFRCPVGSTPDQSNKCVCNGDTPLIAANFRACVSECHGDETISPDKTACLMRCPKFYFYNINRTQCVNKCGVGEQNKDGDCKCDSTHYLSMDGTKCLATCPSGQVAKQGTLMNICACAGSTPYMSSDKLSCISTCEPGEFIYLYTCVANCSVLMHNKTHCIDSCPQGTVQDLVTRTCVDVCPANQAWKEGFCFCPDGEYRNRHNFCVKKCDTDEVYDVTERICVRRCFGGFWDIQGVRCVKKCAPGQVPNYETDTCECSKQTKLNWKTFSCECPADKIILLNDLCGDSCPEGSSLVESDGQKQCQCSNFISSDQTKCIPQCPAGEYSDRTGSLCYSKCPGLLSYDITRTRCVDICGVKEFSLEDKLCQCDFGYIQAMPNGRTPFCVPTCPPTQYIEKGKCKCADGTQFDSDSNTCKCTGGKILSADATQCVSSCPKGVGFNEQSQCQCSAGKFLTPEKDRCVDKCESDISDQQKISADGLSCVYSCPARQFISLLGDKCVNVCPRDSEGLYPLFACRCLTGMVSADGKSCVQQCGVGQYKFFNSTTSVFECRCFDNLQVINGQCACPDNKIISLDQKSCVAACDAGQQLQTIDKVQVCGCEKFIASNNQSCVESCGATELIDNVNRRCSKECFYPFMISMDKKQCVPKCAPGEFDNIDRGQCVNSCPGNQLINEYNKCICPGEFRVSLAGDQCIKDCGFGEYTVYFEMLFVCTCLPEFANINGVCQCSSGVISLDWLSCTDSCPAGSTPGAMSNGAKACTCPKYIAEDKLSCVTDCGQSMLDVDQIRCTSFCFPYASDLLSTKCVVECGPNQLNDMYTCICNENYTIKGDTCVYDPPKPPTPPNKDNKTLIIVLSSVFGTVGAVLLILLVVFIAKKKPCKCPKKQSSQKQKEEHIGTETDMYV
ncbi:Growth_factor receptor cysteine-rich domain superfamily [Hexamita inflata]|uniref:Growth factor receptor cysteine-rich domain superfamily n=2 Tax=Hexamita inflata TaxID=28002 RepID=A0AA86N9D3_9EUKA|nr:Growth factor receptor cysteine-rich domain superfamily [Hexamita inflata]